MNTENISPPSYEPPPALSRFSSKAYEYACRSPCYDQCIVGGQTLTTAYGHIEATPPATPETRGSIEDGIILVPVGRSTTDTVGVPVSMMAAPAAMALGSDDNEGGNVMLAVIDGEDTDGSRGEGILSNAAPDPVPSGAVDNNDPEQEADHQEGAWQGGEWLDEFGVAIGPADWLDEDGIATAPEGWFTAGAAAAAQTQLAGSLFHIEGMPLETILEDVVEEYGPHEGWGGLPVDILIEEGGGNGLPELPEFHQQGNSDESFSNSGGRNGFWKALIASLGYMAQMLRLDVIRTIIYGREAEGGCVCLCTVYPYIYAVSALPKAYHGVIGFTSRDLERVVLACQFKRTDLRRSTLKFSGAARVTATIDVAQQQRRHRDKCTITSYPRRHDRQCSPRIGCLREKHLGRGNGRGNGCSPI